MLTTSLSTLAVLLAGCRFAEAQTVYVASPLGFADSTRDFMNTTLIPAIEKAGVKTVNPWTRDAQVDAQFSALHAICDLPARRAAWARIVDQIGQKNVASIQSVDGVVAVLDGVDVDSGTASEIGFAAALGKWIVGYRGDFRRSGDDEASDVNLQVEYFIRRTGGVIVRNLAELDRELRRRTARA